MVTMPSSSEQRRALRAARWRRARLLGLELGLAGLVLEHVEGLLPSDRDQLGGCAGGTVLGGGDLGGLIQGDLPVAQGTAEVVRVAQDPAGGDGFFRPAQRGARHPGELGGVIDLAGERGDHFASLRCAALPRPSHIDPAGGRRRPPSGFDPGSSTRSIR